MSVHFNTLEEVGDKKFIFKHLDQAYLYLLIEYAAQSSSFFCQPLKAFSFPFNDKTIELKFLKPYECPSKTLAQKTPLPWGAYVATTLDHGNIYHFVYEITDPQGQMQDTQSFETIFKNKKSEDFKRFPLFGPIENVFSDPSLFGKVISYTLDIPSQKIAPIQNKIKLSTTLNVHQYDLYMNRCEEMPAPLSQMHTFQVRLIQPKAKFLKKPKLTQKEIQIGKSFTIESSDLENTMAQTLQILSMDGFTLREYRIWIQRDQPKPSFDIPQSPKSIDWQDLPALIKKNLLQCYEEDDDHFATPAGQELPLNFYFGITLQKLQWKEISFLNYRDASLSLISKGYYFYEEDPKYSEWFHAYTQKELMGDKLLSQMKQREEELKLKPLKLWASLDAIECLNFCFVAQKEHQGDYTQLALSLLDLLQKRIKEEPRATAYSSHEGIQKSPTYTISPQGLAILAFLAGYQLLKKEEWRNQVFDQIHFLLTTYLLETQKFSFGKYDPSALTHTTQALKIASQYFPQFKNDYEKAQKKVLEEFKKEFPNLSLTTQFEILDITTQGFYCYFQ